MTGHGRSNRRALAFATLVAIVVVDGLAYTLVLPVLPFAVLQLGGGAATIAATFSLFSLCQLLASPLLGRLSDRVGRRPVLMLSQVGTALGFLLLAQARRLPTLLAARIIDGVTAGNLAVVNATVCDLHEPERWSDRFSIINAASGLGLLLGLLLAGPLGGGELRTPAAIAFLLAMATVGTSALLPSAPRRAGTATAPRARSARAPVRVLVLGHLLFVALATATPVLLREALQLPAPSALLASAVGVALGGALQAGLATRARASLSEPMQARAAFGLVSAGGLAILAGIRGAGLDAVLLGEVVAVAGVLAALALATACLGRSDPRLGAGAAMGLAQRCAALGQLLGPILAFAALGLAHAAWCLLVVGLGLLGTVASSRGLARPGATT